MLRFIDVITNNDIKNSFQVMFVITSNADVPLVYQYASSVITHNGRLFDC